MERSQIHVTIDFDRPGKQPVGQLHFLERPDRAGILLATRGPALTAQGDCVACIAHDVDPAGLK